MSACIVVLAGVNGAGKSSIAGAAILEAGGEFYNPDLMAAELLAANPFLKRDQANVHAWELGRAGLERALKLGNFFAFETTLGARTITAMLLAGAETGAHIHVSYVGLASVELHLRRVASRVAAGGHDIPETTIRARYASSRENLIRLMPYLASLHVYDNSMEADPKRGLKPVPLLLLHTEARRVVRRAPLMRIPEWAKAILAAAL